MCAPLRLLAVALGVVSVACGAPVTLPTPVGVRTHVDTTFYDVHGTTPREWATSMLIEAPRAGVRMPYVGQTEWNTRWTYASSRMVMGRCAAVSPQVDVEVHFLVPRVVADSGVSAEARAEWSRYMTSLWRHEEGHALRALHAAGGQRDVLDRVRTPRCDALAAEARRQADAVQQKYRDANARYDEVTGHGARQGAILLYPGRFAASIDTTYRDTVP